MRVSESNDLISTSAILINYPDGEHREVDLKRFKFTDPGRNVPVIHATIMEIENSGFELVKTNSGQVGTTFIEDYIFRRTEED